jgi:hypothetical protein
LHDAQLETHVDPQVAIRVPHAGPVMLEPASPLPPEAAS